MMYTEKEVKLLLDKSNNLLKELNAKTTVLNKEIKILTKENKQKAEVISDLDKNNYKEKYLEIEKENEELKKKVNELEDLLNIKKAEILTDSTTSSKPPSTDGFKSKIPNNRKKTGNKPGRQKGHEKSAPELNPNPDEIITVNSVNTCTCGEKTIVVEKIMRQITKLESKLKIIQYEGFQTKCPKCGKKYMPKFPQKLVSPVQYDESLHALIVYLSSHCNVPNEKIADLFKFLTDEALAIAPSTVTNTMKSFGKKSKYTMSRIKQGLLKQDVIYEDETPIKVNGKYQCVIGTFTEKLKYMQAFPNRKIENFIAMGILNIFKGIVVHDHNFRIHNHFKNYFNSECNTHVLRYCEGQYSIHKRQAIKDFMEYLSSLNDMVKELKKEGATSISKEAYEEIREKYLNLLFVWDTDLREEDKKSKYHTKEIQLKKRLREYADDHLRFLTNFNVGFTNNLAERGFRCVKTKLKVSGFRNLDYAGYYCNAISIINTCRAQSVNVKTILTEILSGRKNITKIAYQ